MQEPLNQVEQEHESQINELEARMAASETEATRARLEADSMRQVPFSFLFCYSCYLLAPFVDELF